MKDIIKQCQTLLGSQNVLMGDDVTQRAAGFWSDDGIVAGAIVRPGTTEEVSAILKMCHDAGQTVVTHGGLTNMTEATISDEKDLVLSLERMKSIEDVDPIGRTMTVQSGVILQTAQEAAGKHDLMVTLDLGARGSCTIGGNLSTNAGGNKVIRYGMARDMVLGLEAVLADGTIISSMNKMIKNNAGYDLKHLFIGAEGTLGVITRAVLRLRESPQSENTAFVAFETFDQVGLFLRHMDRSLAGTLSAFEVMWNNFYNLMTNPPATNKAPLPQNYPYYCLVEMLGGNHESDSELFLKSIEAAMEKGIVIDAAVASSSSQSQAMWAIRDDMEQLIKFQPMYNFDISMQFKDMEAYCAHVKEVLDNTFDDYVIFNWGHIGDSNLHFLVHVPNGSEETHLQVEKIFYEPLRKIGGSISAEHGIGIEKVNFLDISRTENELNLMRILKKTLDPKNILNRGKVFEV